MNNIYNHVKGNHPRLNKFDWSYSNTFSASIGYLYPVQCDVVYPGSIIKTNNYIHAEIMPLVAPKYFCRQNQNHTKDETERKTDEHIYSNQP